LKAWLALKISDDLYTSASQADTDSTDWDDCWDLLGLFPIQMVIQEREVFAGIAGLLASIRDVRMVAQILSFPGCLIKGGEPRTVPLEERRTQVERLIGI